MKTMTERTYDELSKLKTFKERYEYLKLGDKRIGEETFGSKRYINQTFYKSDVWKKVRAQIITRDGGNDLGMEGYPISEDDTIIIHHMNPITEDDILDYTDYLTDPNYLICCSLKTHNALHYGSKLNDVYDDLTNTERRPNDTILWDKLERTGR